MRPSLQPGDRVLLRRRMVVPIRAGSIVGFDDPCGGGTFMIKRVLDAGSEGIDVRGDNQAASTDSRHFGLLKPAAVRWVMVRRYHKAIASFPEH